MYSGKRLPRDEVAMLRATGPCHIRSVDGKKVSPSWGQDTIQVELLPGPHSVWVYYERRLRPSGDINLNFVAEGGRSYEVKPHAGFTAGGDWTWTADIVDVTGRDLERQAFE
jgi:hypothetical protein